MNIGINLIVRRVSQTILLATLLLTCPRMGLTAENAGETITNKAATAKTAQGVKGTAEETDKKIKSVVTPSDKTKTESQPSQQAEKEQAGGKDRDKIALQQALSRGQSRVFYAGKLRELGYFVTSINYDQPDYLEYEVVKGHQTYEVQIDFDEKTHKATEVEVVANLWKTDATERVLTANKRTAGKAEKSEGLTKSVMDRAYRYSDRDRAATDALVKELGALPVGKEKQFYRNILKERGYQITKTNTDTAKELEVEMVKNGQSVTMTVAFNEETGTSDEVEASTLWWESAATKEARTGREAKSWFSWAAAPEDRAALLLSRETYDAEKPLPKNFNKESVEQQVRTALTEAMTTEARQNIKVVVLDDGGVVLDGAVSSLGAATAAYNAAASADNARYVVVNLAIEGLKYREKQVQAPAATTQVQPTITSQQEVVKMAPVAGQ